ncbi:hypothetical protein RchiOBHm_Chr1g0326691 [Rosa chinensis]|uniref:Uncharacterized protein n=1 Tax=Rosa chinensis TaxID=74649 RepID=A0A2P6SAA8_ROSCH|nr:hypothetical protein RchiOBHm_Chr1g0326691 [Rosa chinensis]
MCPCLSQTTHVSTTSRLPNSPKSLSRETHQNKNNKNRLATYKSDMEDRLAIFSLDPQYITQTSP